MSCAFITLYSIYSCCAEQKVVFCLHPAALSLYSSTLPTSVWTSSPITSRPQPPMLLSRPYLCFPSFHLAFLWEGCRQTRKSVSNMKLLINVVLMYEKNSNYISRIRIWIWQDVQTMHREGWVREYMWCCWNSSSNNYEFQTITGKQLLYGNLKGFQNARNKVAFKGLGDCGKKFQYLCT